MLFVQKAIKSGRFLPFPSIRIDIAPAICYNDFVLFDTA